MIQTNDNEFPTNNQQLAFALATAGCELVKVENLYTVGFLRTNPVFKGMQVEQAVKFAMDRRIPGQMFYFFKRNEMLNRCVKAWDEIVDELRKAEQEGTAPILPQPPEEVIMQILCVHINNSSRMKEELPFCHAPLIAVTKADIKEEPLYDDKGEVKPGRKIVIKGAGKVWRLGASNATRARLKL